ncbi:hypothetical protein [Salinibacterium sp. SWN1162]|nr:hypothetical protein [Salinibacterium sp. SWN1162]
MKTRVAGVFEIPVRDAGEAFGEELAAVHQDERATVSEHDHF